MRRAARVTIGAVAAGPVTRQASARVTVETAGPGFVEITDAVRDVVRWSGIGDGVVVVFCRHTSASLTVGENADPDVPRDLATALDRLAPRGAGYAHDAEGPDDMPAHIRAMLTDASLAIPVAGGVPLLGRWQGVWLVEHRDLPHSREVVLTITGA